MDNQLATETSPYLLQHADNPVHWRPWGEDAFDEAQRRDVPVFLSIGYSSCHWCHVMAHESFEDDEVAAYLNEHFVSVKVDREERPDVDSVYMTVTQALTGHGGWPMSVFLDHDGRAFHAGTYWPRHRRGGMPSFPEVLAAVVEGWQQRRDAVGDQAARIADHVRERTTAIAAEGAADGFDADGLTREAASAIVASWDRRLGGFGQAPKFPQAMAIGFLLDHHVRTGHPDALRAATHSLRAMVRGGIHDQLTGGFARYATDERWLVPHFEKMLYDNGLLLGALADAAALTGDELLVEAAHRTATAIPDWFEDDSGGFIAATDADSEGEEGRYFVFAHAEAAAVLSGAGLDADRWTRFLGITEDGNWEGTNVLHEAVDRDEFRAAEELDEEAFRRGLGRARTALAEHREERVPPGADDKLIAAWIGLAIRGLHTAADRLGAPRHRRFADAALAAVEEHLVDDDGRLHRSARAGRRGATAFLDDVALIADASLLHAERTGDLDRFDHAVSLVDHALDQFGAEDGGLHTTPADGERLWLRPRDDADNAVPAGTSVLAGVLLRLAALTGDDDRRATAERLLSGFLAPATRWPIGFGEGLRAAERLATPGVEVAVVGPPGAARDRLVAAAVARPVPGLVTFVADTDDDGDVDPVAAARVPLLVGRRAIDGRPTAYVCRAMTCRLPVTDPDAVADQLGRMAGGEVGAP